MTFNYYDIRRPLTYNCLLNFIISNRGYGKTFGAKEFIISRFLKSGDEFIYLRRYKDELKETLPTFFDDIVQENKFPEHELKTEGRKFLCDGKTAGYAVSLSTALGKKSVSYPRVKWIIFDEFIIEKSHYHYIPNEVQAFLNLYETIARTREDVRVLLLANSVTMVNPYFVYFEMTDILREGQEFYRPKDDILLQYVHNEDFVKFKEQTRFGQLVKGTSFADYSIKNQFIHDNRDFIEKRSSDAKYYMTLKYMGVKIGVWVDYKVGYFWCSEVVDNNCKVVYSLTLDDHSPNMLLLKANKSRIIESFTNAYKVGCVRFENIKIKEIMKGVFKICL